MPQPPSVDELRQQAELPLRIGVDGDALRTPVSGVGQYVFNLASELEHLLPHASFFVYSRLPKDRLKLPSDRWIVRREEQRALRKVPSFLWLKTRGRLLCARDELDVFWAARTLHPRLEPTVRTICTVHDLNHLVVPKTMQLSTLWSYRLWFSGDLRTATTVVANSHGTADRLLSLLNVKSAAVCPPGLSSAFQGARDETLDRETVANLNLPSPYFLWVGTLEPRKNVGLLVAAFVALKKRNELRDHSLVLVGAKGWQGSGLARTIRDAEPYGVKVTGYIPDNAMPALYAQATAFVFPSLYEGFGMPVLEARACGTPVVISDIPELREAAANASQGNAPSQGAPSQGAPSQGAPSQSNRVPQDNAAPQANESLPRATLSFDGTLADLQRKLLAVSTMSREPAANITDRSWSASAKTFSALLAPLRNPSYATSSTYAEALR